MADRTFALSLVGEWLQYLRTTKGRPESTVSAYRRILREYVDLCVGERHLEHVSTEQIERFLQRERGGRAGNACAAPATQHRDASCIRSFYTWMQARGEIMQNPAQLVATPTVRNRQPRPIGDADWLRLWNGAGGSDAVALGLGFFCGLRREELTRLRCSHVDIGGRRLVNFVRKGGGEDVMPVGNVIDVFSARLPHLRPEPLWDVVCAQVERKTGDDWLIAWDDLGQPRRSLAAARREPGQLDPQHLNHWLKRMCVAQQVGHVHPHQLRHSCATNLLRAGVPLPMVSTLLNHTNVHTTMRYVKAGGDELSEWLRGNAHR